MFISRLENTVQRYAWGSPDAIPALLGRDNPGGEPWAELWMGDHPRGPSRLEDGGPLSEAIARDPEGVLGPKVAARYGARLPFLFKVLAAARPLSIQCHPDEAQARAGFDREEAAGVPVDAFERNYRDPNHKPELICALTPFRALKGFRPIPELLSAFKRWGCEALAEERAALRARQDGEGLRAFFSALMQLPDDRRREAVAQVVAAAGGPAGARDPERARLIGELSEAYPGDIGVLAPLYLNLLTLSPGEALYLPAGELHAYLGGLALEIMANSDNVLRGGLTPKHVDVPELLKTLRFAAGRPEVLTAHPAGQGVRTWLTPASEFSLSRIVVQSDWQSGALKRVEILLGLEGRVSIEGRDQPPLALPRGASVVVPASAGGYTLRGFGIVARARPGS
jgi:mannose-6-phosphate isomerase